MSLCLHKDRDKICVHTILFESTCEITLHILSDLPYRLTNACKQLNQVNKFWILGKKKI